MRGGGVLLLVVATGCPEGRGDDMQRIDWHPDGVFSIDRYEFPNQIGQFPTHGVTLQEAVEACAEAGKHLCTATEWRAACRGPEGRRWPWGDRPIPDICRLEVDAGGHTSLVDQGANEDGKLSGVAASGAYRDCSTPEGVHDLAGNLEEWVQDDWLGRSGSLEGGAWYTRQSYADCSGDYSRSPDYRLEVDQPVGSAGFRCCTRAEGGVTAALVAADAHARRVLPAAEGPAPGTEEVPIGEDRWMDRMPWPNVQGALPQLGATWTEAGALCGAVGKRLCTAAEWEQACAGPDGLAFPYGNRHVPSACPAAVSASGTFFACESPAGALDMIGGGWEWTATPLAMADLQGGRGPLVEIRGGGSADDPHKARCRPEDGYPAVPMDQSHPALRFRCCRGPLPPVPAPVPPAHRCPEGMRALGTSVCVDALEHPNVGGGLPTGGLSAAEAVSACASAGKRLCTTDEWLAACGGTTGRRWPTGDTWTGGCFVQDGAQGPRPSGAGDCVSPDGVGDLAGNLWEWTEGPGGPELRGGGWLLGAGLAQCRARAVPPEGAEGRAEWGARCCAEPVGP